ncbi:glycosyltransferase family 4 protein [Acinetobacter beijerinckii]|jgi:glycosyltransferase involved in cell wall biosynthesis|uniref:glycosyltransferase family 4 protein n=1 Tax=Acinetobacter beijerinckii TaxID=262668 RepID=UPI002407387F|nr:glycosyltransferase family 4 protein [Acinetobacter beijerinckii]
MKKKRFYLITTIPMSLNFFKGQIRKLSEDFDITLISSPDKELEQIACSENVKYSAIQMKRDIAIKNDIISLLKFLWLFIKQRPDIIHCNTPKGSLLGLIAGYITRVPIRIYYVHGLRYEGATGKKRQLLMVLEKLNCFCATHIIAVSQGVKQKVQDKLTRKKVSVIHHGSANGMPVEEFLTENYDGAAIRESYGITKQDFVFGFVGRLVADKGINELVHAFSTLEQKNVKLLLVGMYEHELDPLSQETQNIIKTNPNIVEVGFQKDVKKFLTIMDLFVSPSYREGFGLSVLEANLMKVPVLVTSITGYSEIVQEGKNGFFVDPKDTLALFNKMKKISQSRDSLLAMKPQCYDEVASKYNHKEVLEKALEYYAQFK